jgi:hypothetical protein
MASDLAIDTLKLQDTRAKQHIWHVYPFTRKKLVSIRSAYQKQ